MLFLAFSCDAIKCSYVGMYSWYNDSPYDFSIYKFLEDPSYIVNVLSYGTSGEDLSKVSSYSLSHEDNSSNDDEYSSNVYELFSSSLSNWINCLIFMMVSFLFDLS